MTQTTLTAGLASFTFDPTHPKPTIDQYRMAHTVCNLKLLDVEHRARWVAAHPNWRDFLDAFRVVCEWEAGRA